MLDQVDYSNLERHIGAYLAAIEGHGLRLRLDDDPAGFAAVRGRFEGYVHPALSPIQSRIAAGTFIWLELMAPDRTVVGCTAMRRFDGERLADLIWSRRLWGDRFPLLRPIRPLTLTWPRGMTEPAGRLVYSGGLYLDRAWRSHGLGVRMVRLLRALAVRDWVPDWVFGLAQEKMARAGFTTEHYGYTRVVPCFNEVADFGPKYEQEWLSTISLDEIRAELDGEPYAPVVGAAGGAALAPPDRKAPVLDQAHRDHALAAGQ